MVQAVSPNCFAGVALDLSAPFCSGAAVPGLGERAGNWKGIPGKAAPVLGNRPFLGRDWDYTSTLTSSSPSKIKYLSYEPALEQVRWCWYEKPVFFLPGTLESNFGLIPFLQAVWYDSSKEDVISTATGREEAILKKGDNWNLFF